MRDGGGEGGGEEGKEGERRKGRERGREEGRRLQQRCYVNTGSEKRRMYACMCVYDCAFGVSTGEGLMNKRA